MPGLRPMKRMRRLGARRSVRGERWAYVEAGAGAIRVRTRGFLDEEEMGEAVVVERLRGEDLAPGVGCGDVDVVSFNGELFGVSVFDFFIAPLVLEVEAVDIPRLSGDDSRGLRR